MIEVTSIRSMSDSSLRCNTSEFPGTLRVEWCCFTGAHPHCDWLNLMPQCPTRCKKKWEGAQKRLHYVSPTRFKPPYVLAYVYHDVFLNILYRLLEPTVSLLKWSNVHVKSHEMRREAREAFHVFLSSLEMTRAYAYRYSVTVLLRLRRSRMKRST